MTIAQSLKAEMIFISLILLTACGAQPTTEPTPAPTATQIVEPMGTATATSTPAPSETPTLGARMTVEQQKAYLDAHKIPYIVKPNGELQFDFMKMYTETASIKVGHQETLGADLVAAAAEYDVAFPEPPSYNSEDFSVVRWASAPSEKQEQTIYKITVISDDYSEKRIPTEPIGVVLADIEGKQCAFFYVRSPLTDTDEILKNDGNPFITYWVMTGASSFTLDSSEPTETLNQLSEGRLQFLFSTILGNVEGLASEGEIDLNIHPELNTKDRAWRALHANLDTPTGDSALQIQSDEVLQKLVEGKGFSASMKDKVFLGSASRPEDVRERTFVSDLDFPPQP